MIASERFSKIVGLVNKKEFVSTKELSEIMNVTETTIRRDCEELEKQGMIIRVHGGAKSIQKSTILSNIDEKKMSERIANNKEKDLVCQKAALFVKDGDCIFLDGGTTIVPILKYLRGKKIKIVTHSQLIANIFDDLESELFLIGGKYSSKYNMTVGPIALRDLERFNFDYAFLSCVGVDTKRNLVYTTEIETMAIKQKAMELATKKYLLIDSSKLRVKSFCSFIKSSDFDAVICNIDEHIDIEEIPDNYIMVKDK